MPNTQSAKKRLRQSETRRLRNRMQKSSLRTQLKKVRAAVTVGELEVAEQEARATAAALDRAGAQRVIHPNKASRLKSRMQHLIRKAKLASSQPGS